MQILFHNKASMNTICKNVLHWICKYLNKNDVFNCAMLNKDFWRKIQEYIHDKYYYVYEKYYYERKYGLNVKIKRICGNEYLKYLSNASLVISLGGYNSIIESIAAKKTMLVYQRGFSGVNKEQDLRITLFENNASLSILKPEDLDKESLSNIIVSMIEEIKTTKIELDFDGVKNSTNALLDLYNNYKSI